VTQVAAAIAAAAAAAVAATAARAGRESGSAAAVAAAAVAAAAVVAATVAPGPAPLWPFREIYPRGYLGSLGPHSIGVSLSEQRYEAPGGSLLCLTSGSGSARPLTENEPVERRGSEATHLLTHDVCFAPLPPSK